MLDALTIERVARTSAGAPIVVALSGGGDSVALLWLMAEYFGPASVRALIVDHALREGSADDAKRAQLIASAAGVAAEILTVSWPHGVKRGQAAARGARYGILCDRARELGAKVIAVAHTADDQIETVLMRASAGSSWRGLAGMSAFAPAPVWPAGRGVWLARPLLGQRRAALRACLRERRADWIEDPANANATFERVRVRAQVAEQEAAGADAMRLAALAARIRPHVEKLDAEAGALITGSVSFEGAAIFLDSALWSAPEHVRRRALSVLITAAGGAAREPSSVERIDRMLLEGIIDGGSLGGAHVAKTRLGFSFSRDRGALMGRADGLSPISPQSLQSHRLTVWDRRLELCVAGPGWSVVPTTTGAELCREGERRPLARDEATWLLRGRVAHLLGEHD